MKTRLLSALLVFLLVASVSFPAVSAETPQVYYELHNLCACNAKEDLGKVPYLTWGIGYEAWIDKQTDNWKVFVHAGTATKNLIITPETELGKLVTLKDFVDNVDKCREESDQIPSDALVALSSGALGSAGAVYGGLTDNAPAVGSGLVAMGYSVEKIYEITRHLNNAKDAQKNAETLFDEL